MDQLDQIELRTLDQRNQELFDQTPLPSDDRT